MGRRLNGVQKKYFETNIIINRFDIESRGDNVRIMLGGFLNKTSFGLTAAVPKSSLGNVNSFYKAVVDSEFYLNPAGILDNSYNVPKIIELSYGKFRDKINAAMKQTSASSEKSALTKKATIKIAQPSSDLIQNLTDLYAKEI